MPLIYKVIPSERNELSEVICDRCDKRIQLAPGHWNQFGTPYSFYHEPWADEEYVIIRHMFGFFSDQKDGSEHESVLCESCYDAVFKNVKIKVTEHL